MAADSARDAGTSRGEPAAGRPSPTAARLLVVASAALASTGGAAIKLTSLSALEVAGLRAGLAAIVLLVLLRPGRGSWRPATFAVGAIQGVMMVAFVAANKLTTAASAIYLQSTAPLYVLVASPLLLGEPVRARDLGYLLVFAAGLAAVFVGTDDVQATAPDPHLGNLVAIASGVGWAATIVGLRWLAARGAGAAAQVTATSAVTARHADPAGAAAVVANALVFAVTLPLVLPIASSSPARDALAVAWLGVVQVGLSYACLTRGLRGTTAFDASLLLLAEPVLSPLWAWLVHAERPGPWSIAGGIAILGASAARTWRERRAFPADRVAIRPRP